MVVRSHALLVILNVSAQRGEHERADDVEPAHHAVRFSKSLSQPVGKL